MVHTNCAYGGAGHDAPFWKCTQCHKVLCQQCTRETGIVRGPNGEWHRLTEVEDAVAEVQAAASKAAKEAEHFGPQTVTNVWQHPQRPLRWRDGSRAVSPPDRFTRISLRGRLFSIQPRTRTDRRPTQPAARDAVAPRQGVEKEVDRRGVTQHDEHGHHPPGVKRGEHAPMRYLHRRGRSAPQSARGHPSAKVSSRRVGRPCSAPQFAPTACSSAVGIMVL